MAGTIPLGSTRLIIHQIKVLLRWAADADGGGLTTVSQDNTAYRLPHKSTCYQPLHAMLFFLPRCLW